MFTDMVACDLCKLASAGTIKTQCDNDIKTGSTSGWKSIGNPVTCKEYGTFQNIPVIGFSVIADFTIFRDIIGWRCICGAAPEISASR